MRVFVCGEELGLGFVVAQRLLAEGHKVTMLTSFEDLIPNLTKNNMNPILGRIQDATVQRQLAKADAAIDVELPNTFPLRKVQVAPLRPSLLRQAFEGSRRPLIVTSNAAILGDTGPVPASESARLRPLSGFAWLPRLEEEILKASGVRGIVIRPAWHVHGRRPQSSAIPVGWLRLAKRLRRGKYIGSGENRYSAVHFDDLADLYCIALKKTPAGTILHGASENFSMIELATAIHRGLGYKGEPSSLSLKDAQRFSPIAYNLTLSHALSGDLARTLGWKPSRDSIMKEIEQDASAHAYVSKLKLPRTECKKK
jgi:nucleoside-diphosphate-sugar epimerase